MFRELKRKNKALTNEECENILRTANTGVLALHGDDDYPYAVPLNFIYEDNKIYFHCASEGHKIDSIKRNPKASFCVVSKDTVIPEKLTTKYESIIVFGRVHIIEDEEEKLNAIKKLSFKYAPHENSDAEIKKYWNALTMLQFNVEHISGKKAK